jgi:hypothetical protein
MSVLLRLRLSHQRRIKLSGSERREEEFQQRRPAQGEKIAQTAVHLAVVIA